MTQVETFTSACKASVSQHLLGKEDVLNKVLAAMLCGGHVLLNDIPGTGKTMLARTLAQSMDGTFHRVQFTPDLLPGDVTGVSVYDPEKRAFSFQPGPVFTNILLADEINRATPRTQSALLECMEEHTVTADGVTYRLDPPFFVIATQNPVEMQGTYPLPEAQLDRFLLCLTLGYPNRDDEITLLSRTHEPPAPTPVTDTKTLLAAQKEVENIKVSEAVCNYAADIADATRHHNQITLGLSTRGLLALLHVSKAVAAIQGDAFVTPDHIKSIAADCIAHRLVIRGRAQDESLQASRDLVQEILNTVPVPKEELWN